MPKRRSSSGRWLQEHFSDQYVKEAQATGLRSRSAYKLLEIQERDRLFKPGMLVIDLGASPGGWSQIASRFIKPKGQVIAIDILPMEDLPAVTFLLGDFTDEVFFNDLLEKITEIQSGKDVDWVLSDMAPNMSGNASIDIPKSMYLAELAVNFAVKILSENGGIVIKVFQGEGFDQLLAAIRQVFAKVVLRKPKASRSRSREIYIVARHKKSK